MAKEKPATKICKYCKTEIDYTAKVCPQCRKRQSSVVKTIAIVVLILFLLSLFFGGSDDTEQTSDENPKKVAGSASEEIEQEEVEDVAEDVENEFKVGDIVETSDLKISFISAEEYTSDNQFIQPQDGNVFYEMVFEFENISENDQYISSYDFTCYADDYDMEQSWMDGLDLDATISSGKKTKGSVFFEVPKDTKSIVLEYETNFWTETKVVFIVK